MIQDQQISYTVDAPGTGVFGTTNPTAQSFDLNPAANQSRGGITGASGTTFTQTAHGFTTGDAAYFTTLGTAAAGSLAPMQTVYIRSLSANTFQVHGSKSDAINNTAPFSITTSFTNAGARIAPEAAAGTFANREMQSGGIEALEGAHMEFRVEEAFSGGSAVVLPVVLLGQEADLSSNLTSGSVLCVGAMPTVGALVSTRYHWGVTSGSFNTPGTVFRVPIQIPGPNVTSEDLRTFRHLGVGLINPAYSLAGPPGFSAGSMSARLVLTSQLLGPQTAHQYPASFIVQ